MNIPKIIHFIWAGGDLPMPEQNIAVVKAWATANPTFDIFLWVDQKSASSSSIYESNIEYYQQLFDEIKGRIHYKDIDHTVCLQEENIRIADHYSRYEINRLRPNYGASSDLLRYKILYELGGAYFDSDVSPGKTTLEESQIFQAELSKHHIFVDNNSQNTGLVGNDAIISTSRNPLMNQIWETAKHHYHLQLKDLNPNDELYRSNLILAEKNTSPILTYQYDDADYILQTTPFKTGPYCIRKNVQTAEGELKEASDDGVSLIKPMIELTTVSQNDRGWVRMPLLLLSKEETIKRIAETIAFEAKELHLLRLDDHVNNLVEAIQCDGNFAAQTVISLLNDTNLHNLVSVQLTYCNDITIQFCEANKLLDKTYLFPLVKNCHASSQTTYYYEAAILAVMAIPQYTKLINSLDEYPNKKKESLQTISKINERMLKLLNHSLSYCTNCMEKTGNTNRLLNSQKSIVADYLRFLSENLAIAKNEAGKLKVSLRSRDVEDHKESDETTEFTQTSAKIISQIDAFLIYYKLKDLTHNVQRTMIESPSPEEKNNENQQGKDDDPACKCHCRLS